MIKTIIPIVLLFTVPTNGTGEKQKPRRLQKIKVEEFTSTEKYQIMAWTIKKFEGYSGNSYVCPAGVRTTGWGFTDVKSVKNVRHADEIFKDELNQRWEIVNDRFPKMDYLQKAAVVSLLYNVGDINKIQKSSFVKALRRGNHELAVKRLQKWNKIRKGGKLIELDGLTNRRKFESKLITGNFTREDYNSLKEDVEQHYKRK